MSYSTYVIIIDSTLCSTKHPLNIKRPNVYLQTILAHWLQVLKLAQLCFWDSCLTFWFFCLYISALFMIFDLQNRARNNSWSACWPPRPSRINSLHPNGVFHNFMRKFPVELQSWNQLPDFTEVPICQYRVHLSHSQVPCKLFIRPELSRPCPLNCNRSMSSIVVFIYLAAVS